MCVFFCQPRCPITAGHGRTDGQVWKGIRPGGGREGGREEGRGGGGGEGGGGEGRDFALQYIHLSNEFPLQGISRHTRFPLIRDFPL